MRFHQGILAGCLLALATPTTANLVVELTLEEKMNQSTLVAIGTVVSVEGGGRNRVGSNATFQILQRLKGESEDTLTVSTYSRIAELGYRCCEAGATYLMFLSTTPDGRFVSIQGAYGMIRIGGAPNRITVIPAEDLEP